MYRDLGEPGTYECPECYSEFDSEDAADACEERCGPTVAKWHVRAIQQLGDVRIYVTDWWPTEEAANRAAGQMQRNNPGITFDVYRNDFE